MYTFWDKNTLYDVMDFFNYFVDLLDEGEMCLDSGFIATCKM